MPRNPHSGTLFAFTPESCSSSPGYPQFPPTRRIDCDSRRLTSLQSKTGTSDPVAGEKLCGARCPCGSRTESEISADVAPQDRGEQNNIRSLSIGFCPL